MCNSVSSSLYVGEDLRLNDVTLSVSTVLSTTPGGLSVTLQSAHGKLSRQIQDGETEKYCDGSNHCKFIFGRGGLAFAEPNPFDKHESSQGVWTVTLCDGRARFEVGSLQGIEFTAFGL